MDINTILLSALTGLLGAVIGTYLGAYFINRKDENKIRRVREIAIKGLDIVKKYAKNNWMYNNAQNEFNNTLNIAEKRAVLVCLHKIGVPIEMPIGKIFDAQNIQFISKPIDKDEIENMKMQINSGHCDHIFFMDIDTYFTENTKIKTIRNIGKKYVAEVLSKSKYDFKSKVVTYPERCLNIFSHGEWLTILVLHDKVVCPTYFDQQTGCSDAAKIEQLKQEIDIGLWDGYLQWDYSAYKSMEVQTQFAEVATNAYKCAVKTQRDGLYAAQTKE